MEAIRDRSLKNIIFSFLFLSITTLLTACGGGSGGSNDPTPSNSSISSTPANSFTANAGQDITVDAGTKVTLDPHATVINPNGFSMGDSNISITGTSTVKTDIVGISWTKVSGPSVGLSTTSTTDAKVSFTAPNTGNADSIQIVYKLTLTNADGKTAEDTITITIKRVAGVKPEISLYFPPAFGAYSGNTISAFGSAKATNATIASVTVTAGLGNTQATINEDGSWRADPVAIPADANKYDVVATVTDSNGQTTTSVSHLSRSTSSVGTGTKWNKSLAIGVNDTTNTAYVFASGNVMSDLRLFSVDLKTGNRGSDISNFGNAAQGINSSAILTATYSPTEQLFYYSTSPLDTTKPHQIISINTSTGKRTLISDSTRGTGPNLNIPTNIVIGRNGVLYVANYGDHSILSVDVKTGNRTLIADRSSTINSADFLAINATQDTLFIAPYIEKLFFLSMNLTDMKIRLFSNSDDAFLTIGKGDVIRGELKALAFDTSLNKLLAIDNLNRLYSIDAKTGDRVDTGVLVGVLDIVTTYDQNKHLLYAAEDTGNSSLNVYDVVGNHAVTISH